jgi:hypothetical protein
VHGYWICQGQEAIACCRTAIVSIFLPLPPPSLPSFFSFCSVCITTSRCVHGELNRPCSGRMILVYMYYYECYL